MRACPLVIGMDEGEQLLRDERHVSGNSEGEDTSSGTATNSNHGSSAEDDDRETYLIVLDYTDEAERKRVEYLLNNRDGTDVSPLRGFVRSVKTDDLPGLYEDLSAKVDDVEDLEVKRLEDVDTTPSETDLEFEIETDVDADRIEWLFESLMNKRDAAVANPRTNVYKLSTRKGTAQCWYRTTDNPDGSITVTVYTSGYGEAPRVVRDYLKDEMEGFL